jgi:nucleotide-binding universal stress UspA family protein
VKILLAVDESKFSEAAANAIVAQVKTNGTKIKLLHVLEPFPVALAEQMGSKTSPDFAAARQTIRDRASAYLNEAAEKLRSAGYEASCSLEEGDARESILDYAERWGADLIIVGSRGRTGIKAFLMGSVSEAVAHYARCSVQIVRIRSDH